MKIVRMLIILGLAIVGRQIDFIGAFNCIKGCENDLRNSQS
jgi:hypothetical protein